MSEDLEEAVGQIARRPRPLIRASINGHAQKELKIPAIVPPGLEPWKERLEKIAETGGLMTEKEFGEVMKTLSAYHAESKEATARLQEQFHQLNTRVSLLDQSLDVRKEELKTLAKAVGDLAPLVRDIPDLKDAIEGLSALVELKDDVEDLKACEQARAESRKTFKQQVRNSAISWAVPIACAAALTAVGVIMIRAINSLSDIRNAPQVQAVKQDGAAEEARRQEIKTAIEQAVQQTTQRMLDAQPARSNRFAGRSTPAPKPEPVPGPQINMLKPGEMIVTDPTVPFLTMRAASRQDGGLE